MHNTAVLAQPRPSRVILHVMRAVLLLSGGAASVVLAGRPASERQRHARYAGAGAQRAGVPGGRAGVPLHGA